MVYIYTCTLHLATSVEYWTSYYTGNLAIMDIYIGLDVFGVARQRSRRAFLEHGLNWLGGMHLSLCNLTMLLMLSRVLEYIYTFDVHLSHAVSYRLYICG